MEDLKGKTIVEVTATSAEPDLYSEYTIKCSDGTNFAVRSFGSFGEESWIEVHQTRSSESQVESD